jgi:hypothetical protein
MFVLELQKVKCCEQILEVPECVFHSRLLGSWAVFRIVMRATNEGH